MSYVPAARPDTFTALGLPLAVSRYPRIIRLLPATSAMGVLQTLSEVQLTVAPVAAPVSSSRLSGEELFAPAASFQFAFATTPADSELAIAVPLPTKSTLIATTPGFAPSTPRVTVAVCDKMPLVAVIVRVELPSGVLPIVVIVSVEVPEGVI